MAPAIILFECGGSGFTAIAIAGIKLSVFLVVRYGSVLRLSYSIDPILIVIVEPISFYQPEVHSFQAILDCIFLSFLFISFLFIGQNRFVLKFFLSLYV